VTVAGRALAARIITVSDKITVTIDGEKFSLSIDSNIHVEMRLRETVATISQKPL
jgi:hypothetical protein